MDVTSTHQDSTRPCPKAGDQESLKAAQVISRVGDKWAVLVIMELYLSGHRFNELKRSIDGISQRMLTLTVRNLERDGLIARRVTPTIPPRVDYELTTLGRSLAEPVKALGDWAFANIGAIGEAQSAFDAQHAG